LNIDIEQLKIMQDESAEVELESDPLTEDLAQVKSFLPPKKVQKPLRIHTRRGTWGTSSSLCSEKCNRGKATHS
jgi:hypothetical protein